MSEFVLENCSDWQSWVTPKGMETKPIHRWYVFPHSFTSELVDALAAQWELGRGDKILDPFVGAGTTILAAKQRGIPANGHDLSPLAVLASSVKVANYDPERLRSSWHRLMSRLETIDWLDVTQDYSELVRRALPGKLLAAFDSIFRQIGCLSCSTGEQDFFRLALLTILPKYSRAVATGGWLSWIDNRTNSRSLIQSLNNQITLMLDDLACVQFAGNTGNHWHIELADARLLPDADSTYTAVITSPPYPNRHDYTRVFGIELMLNFLNWEETRRLRYQSFHSHPEAKPERPDIAGYVRPRRLSLAINRLAKHVIDPRVEAMLRGYFVDMFICLRECYRVCRTGAKLAFVLGNAQYNGIQFPVDMITAEIGESVGLVCDKIIVARYRGNSAQQMSKHGRMPSRESVVVFEKR